jgi:hypothetical protein
LATRKKKKSYGKRPGGKRGVARKRKPRPRPRPRPVWLRLGPPTWLQNSPGVWIQVTFVRQIGRTVQVRVKQKGARKPSTVSLALSNTKKRLKRR